MWLSPTSPCEHIERAHRIVPIVSVQNRYSFSDREWDYRAGLSARRRESRFCPGDRWRRARKANEVVEKIAAARNVSTAVVSLAWLLRPLAGDAAHSRHQQREHLEENVSAAGFKLTDAEFAELGAVVPKPYWLACGARRSG